MSDGNVQISPVGKLVYPYLNQPRQYQGKGKFAYDTALDVEGEEGETFARWIEEYAADYAKRVGKRSINIESLVMPAIDREKEEIANTLRFRFKIAVLETKQGTWDRKPAFYQADGTPYDPEPTIGGGTVAQIAFTIYEWQSGPNRGMTLQPEGILIHELVERKGGIAVDRSWENLFAGKIKAAAPAATKASSRKKADAPSAGADF